MVEKQGLAADDPHADQHQHHGQQNARHPEAAAHEQLAQTGARTAAEVLDGPVEAGIVGADALQYALVAAPADEVEEHGGRGIQPDEK